MPPRPLAFIMDLDGTLTRPILDFDHIRRDLGLDPGRGILEQLDHIAGHQAERAAELHQRLIQHELDAARRARPNHGLHPLMECLNRRRISMAVVTRNTREHTRISLNAIGISVHTIVTRECAPPKPSPEPVLLACRRLNVPPQNAWMIGDWIDDARAGAAAGCAARILLTNGADLPHCPEATHRVQSLYEVHALLEPAAAPTEARAESSPCRSADPPRSR